MSLLDDLAMNLTKAEALLHGMLAAPQERHATIAEIETLVHPAIKTATRLMIQVEARRLVESDPAVLIELDAALTAASRLLTRAETLLRQLPRKR
jgi:hypothetical protein